MSFQNIQTQLETEFNAFQATLNGRADSAFNLKRKEAFGHFKSLGLPTTKNEDWKYSSLKKVDKQAFTFPKNVNRDLSGDIFPKISGNRIVFINGQYSETLSDSPESKKLEILTLKDAQKQKTELLEEYYAKHLNQENDGATAANIALADNGVVIFIPKNTTLEAPLTIHFISDSQQENIAINLHNLVIAEQNSEAKIVEIYETVGENAAFENYITEIFVKQDARVDYYKIQDENNLSTHIGTTQVYQEQKSYFYSATVSLNGGFIRNDLNLILDGEYIESHMYGLYIPNESQHIDNHTLVDHRMPNCESNELYKGVLADKSTGVFNGKIFVRQDAQKTNAYQNCRNVITSDSATMNTKPQLEIWADDVKCSHGTTTGKLNDEAIFYMQSRGIPKPDAIRLQLVAFAEDVVSQIKIEELREILDAKIEQKLQ